MHTIVREEETACIADEFDVIMANSPQQLDEVFRLRYQVYCLEKGWEKGRAEKEIDEFDFRARHVLLRHRDSGEAIGTVRIIPTGLGGLDSLPMASLVCPPEWKRRLSDRTTGEISRFAISKRRRLGCRASALIRLGLMQGTLRLSWQLGLSHWCAVMEPTLLRLLAASGIRFSPLGPMVNHHGLRLPVGLDVDALLDSARVEQPALWTYATLGGAIGDRVEARELAA